MYQGELQEFLRQWKGEKVIAEFTIVPNHTSVALKGYYYHCVVPAMQKALWESGERKTKEATEIFLREQSPICYEETPVMNNGDYKYQTRLKDIHELSNAELIEHIETIKQLGAEEYSVYIEDPKTI